MQRKLYEQNRFDTDSQACLLEPSIIGGPIILIPRLSLRYYERAMFIIQGGAANDAAATLNIRALQSDTGLGGNEKVIAGKAITQVTAGVGFADRNDLWCIHIEVPELDVNNQFRWVTVEITVSQGDTWLLSVVCQRETRGYEPVPALSYTEIVD